MCEQHETEQGSEKNKIFQVKVLFLELSNYNHFFVSFWLSLTLLIFVFSTRCYMFRDCLNCPVSIIYGHFILEHSAELVDKSLLSINISEQNLSAKCEHGLSSTSLTSLNISDNAFIINIFSLRHCCLVSSIHREEFYENCY